MMMISATTTSNKEDDDDIGFLFPFLKFAPIQLVILVIVQQYEDILDVVLAFFWTSTGGGKN